MPSLTFTSLFTNQTLTRSDFITNLRTRIDEDNSDIINDTQIQELIRQGNYDICFSTGLLPEYAEVTPDGSASYTLPTNMAELYDIYYISADSPAAYTLLQPYNFLQLQEDGYSDDTMMYYIRNGQQLEVFGASGVTTGTIRAYGTRIPTFPASGTAYIDLPDQYLELMYLWCIWKYWVRRRSPDESALAQNNYERRVQLVKDQVEKQYSRGVTAYG